MKQQVERAGRVLLRSRTKERLPWCFSALKVLSKVTVWSET